MTATTVGSTVEVDRPQKTDRSAFFEVREMNKAGETVRTALFSAADVVGLVEGHNEPVRKAKK